MYEGLGHQQAKNACSKTRQCCIEKNDIGNDDTNNEHDLKRYLTASGVA